MKLFPITKKKLKQRGKYCLQQRNEPEEDAVTSAE